MSVQNDPTVAPGPHELADLELLLNGAYQPLRGFLGRTDAEWTCRAGFLADGTLWPVPVTLQVPDSVEAGATVVLTDPEGAPLASLQVDEVWEDVAGRRLAGGPVTAIARPEHGPFRRLMLSPEEVHDRLGSGPVLGVVTARPLLQVDLSRIRDASRDHGARVLVLVATGSPEFGLTPESLVRSVLAARAELPAGALVVPVPLFDHGRDQDRNRALRRRVATAYGADEVLEPDPSDAERLDDPLGTGDPLPAGLAPAAVARELARAAPPRDRRGVVVFFTGLSGSGKSTIARALHDTLLERGDRNVTLLDGDVVRRLLSAGLTFSRADRDLNIRRIGFVAAEVARHGGLAICAPIAPYAATRAEVRRMVTAAGGGFLLVHVATPLEVCEQRDRKGLYAKARAGLIPEFTGVSDPYEAPDDADLVLDTSQTTLEEALARILTQLTYDGWLKGAPWTGD